MFLGERENLTTEELKNSALSILLSYKYEKINGLACADIIVNGSEIKDPRTIKVINITTGFVFDTLKDAAQSINMEACNFSKRLKRNTLKDFEFYNKKIHEQA